MPIQKELLQVSEVLILFTGETSYHSQVLRSAIYSLVIIHNGKVGFMLIVNGDRHLIKELEDRLVPGHVK